MKKEQKIKKNLKKVSNFAPWAKSKTKAELPKEVSSCACSCRCGGSCGA